MKNSCGGMQLSTFLDYLTTLDDFKDLRHFSLLIIFVWGGGITSNEK